MVYLQCLLKGKGICLICSKILQSANALLCIVDDVATKLQSEQEMLYASMCKEFYYTYVNVDPMKSQAYIQKIWTLYHIIQQVS